MTSIGARGTEHAMGLAIAAVVARAGRGAWAAIALFALLTAASVAYLFQDFAITTDSSQLISPNLPWRQGEIALDRAFPQRADLINVVIDATSPELADRSADRLADALRARPNLFRDVTRPGGEPFFAQNGLLFESLDDLKRDSADLIGAQPFLGTLAPDPSLRGLMGVLSQALEGVRLGRAKLDELADPFAQIAEALERLKAGQPPTFSPTRLISGRAPSRGDLRRFVNVQPVLDFADLQPGGRATAAVREEARALGLTPEEGVTVRLTGPVALSDEEFGTVAEGAGPNALATMLALVLILWLALRQARIILAVLLCLVAGLAITSAVGLWLVGAFNLISVAFAVLFLGLGIDFGIQFSVRFRAERHAGESVGGALAATARAIGGPLLLAALSIAAAFYSFLPTAYRGLSELGLIAGTGMFVAFGTTVLLLPALLAVLKPAGEAAPIGWAALAPVDRFLARHRKGVVGCTLAAVLLGSPLLLWLRFDFNPLDLRSPATELVSTILDLMRDPETSPNKIDVLEPDLPAAEALAERLRKLPEVAQVLTADSFVPEDQEEKLDIIADAAFFLQASLSPEEVKPAPTDEETIAALRGTAKDLRTTIGSADGLAAREGRRLADRLDELAAGPAAARAAAEAVLIVPLKATLARVATLLTAAPVTLQSLPATVLRDWVTADGRARVEVAPRGNSDDNATLRRFAAAVRTVAPNATGTPIFIIEAANTIVSAFLQAALWSVLSIAALLFLVLRRVADVALTLVPLLVAAVLTLEISVAIGLPLNFANIIALPLLLGVGVAFKIYYVVAWRAGETQFLQSSLTRAVFFSALTTATAFGSLWLSHHPGTSSMGKLMALSLVTTLAAALLFQPALLATAGKSATPGR